MFLISGEWSYGQNLVPNPGFETIAFCPTTYSTLCQLYAPPWACGTNGSSDLFNPCGNPGTVVGVPQNGVGYQGAHGGAGYAGFLARWSAPEYREYVTTQLSSPLIAGQWYYVEFYVSPGETGCAIEPIGAYFSSSDPFIATQGPLPYEPQIETSNVFLNDYENWMQISGCFEATGGEQYITIGNFRADAETPFEAGCSLIYSYYYIDDVSVTEGSMPEEIIFDLGGPEFACFSYTIDPELDGPYFDWSDGSHGPTLDVTVSGTYTVTVSDGCSFGVDSIEVIIAGNYDPVDIGPDELEFCSGDSYSISLDPDLSEYTWHDGSSDPDYTITTSGTYSVTLDDGCLITSDEIVVEVLEPLAPFDLGDDFFLCIDDEFEFSFDPALGDFHWQDNTTSSTYTITNAGTYALTISNICGMESDEIIIYDLEIPVVDIGPDVQVLCNGDILEVEVDPQMGEIVWQDGSDQPNYEISQPGLYEVFVTNMCGTANAQVLVTVIDPPFATLGT